MRILILANDFKPRSGGVAEYTDCLASELHKSGDSILVVSVPMPGAAAFDEEVDYAVSRVPRAEYGRTGCIMGRVLRFGKRFKTVMDAIMSFAPDVCLLNHTSGYFDAAYLASRVKAVPIVLLAHDKEVLGENSRIVHLALKWVMNHIDAVVANSRYTAGLCRQTAPKQQNVHVVHPGVRVPFRKTEARRDCCEQVADLARLSNRRVLLTICRLVRHKGIEHTLRAVAEVVKCVPEVIYVVAGEEGEANATEKLEALSRDLGLEDHVWFGGHVSEAEKHCLLEMAECFVMLSRDLPGGHGEGFGIVFLEAALHGVPSIGGRTGGIPEAVLHGETGLIVDPEDPHMVAQTMMDLLSDRDWRDRLGSNAMRRAVEVLTWPKQASQIRRILREVVRARRPS